MNFIFFGLLLLLLIAMVGVTLYSDYTYQGVNARYREFKKMFEHVEEDLNKSRAELNLKDKELQEKEQALVDIINELNLSKQRVSSLSDYYTTVRSEKDVLESDLSQTQEERDKWKTDYTTARTDLGVCEKNYDLKKEEVKQLELTRVLHQNYAKIAESLAESMMDILKTVKCDNSSTCNDKIENVTETLEDLQAELDKIK